ncbi:hypothetical protein MGN70_013894 [Eutypa lata]|nr:hypothetical protein MGN70_013894 [Eutypa lata]
MVVKRGLAAQGCYQCRLAVLRLFTGPSSPAPFARTTGPPLLFRPRRVAPTFTRSFSSPTKETNPLSEQHDSEQNLEEESGTKYENGETITPDAASAADDVPWYLQVEPPRHVATIEPPPLPEVPEGSPTVVSPLVEYASEELGLDELSLLDLRELDPPPALGPNLFMLFGTARSERHLQVSAGRLVRWLRYKHRIYADADGLLGPNERKKKLRRKAKRAKLLGTMGTDDYDDGIKTGWVCVNLGTIGRSGGESTVVAEDGRVAGFGVAQSGSTIVVQIMTESRRAELNLETLWKNTLDPPSVEESQPPRKELGKPREERLLTNLHPLERAMLGSSPTRPVARNNRTRDPSFGQASFYSTIPAKSSAVDATDPLRDLSRENVSRVLTYDANQKIRVLELLRARLSELPPIDARRAVGGSLATRATTPFLQLFERACKHLPPSQTWEYRLAIQARSRVFLDDARALLREMRTSGIAASRDQHLQLLTCVLGAQEGSPWDRSALALDVLRTMQQRGQGLLANDVVAALIEGKMASHWRRADHEAVERLRQLAVQADLPCMDEPLLMRLMVAYARRGYWDGIWDAWRMPARHMRPRSPALYRLMFSLAADSKNAFLCTLVARQCFQEMIAEHPPVWPVPGSELRDALMDCIHVADSQAKRIAAATRPDAKGVGAALANREFVKIIHVLQNMR